ncbi:hypothetical protein LSAT2_023808 [Lamellibrachia satsuma]|nr:hypothetical protein LSAT2_023808 [Lamellibrachia satsuma]
MNQLTLLALTLAVLMMALQQGKGEDAECITSCEDRLPGNYQSCQGCGVFATCDASLKFFDNRPCPATLVWDDNVKNCRGYSATCGTSDNGGNNGTCVTSCKDLQPGNYQSCQGCSVYVTCTAGGSFFDNRPCPATLVWDDNAKNCRGFSATCSP